MALKSMKLSQSVKPTICAEAKCEEPRYPYGLSLHLEEDALEKLGLDKLPAVGTVLTLKATVKVDSASIREHEGSEKRRTLGLQITAMDLGEEEKEKDDATFGKKKVLEFVEDN